MDEDREEGERDEERGQEVGERREDETRGGKRGRKLTCIDTNARASLARELTTSMQRFSLITRGLRPSSHLAAWSVSFPISSSTFDRTHIRAASVLRRVISYQHVTTISN